MENVGNTHMLYSHILTGVYNATLPYVTKWAEEVNEPLDKVV